MHAPAATKAAISAGFHAAKRRVWCVVEGAAIDVTDAAMQLMRDLLGADGILTKDRANQPVFTVIGNGNRL